MSPEVSQTSVVLDFLKSLEILSQLSVNSVGDELGSGSISWAVLSVQEPFGDAVLGRALEDVVDSLDLSLSDLSGSLVKINTSGLEDDVGHSAANSLDGSEGEHDLDGTFDVCVLHTENVDEVILTDDFELRL